VKLSPEAIAISALRRDPTEVAAGDLWLLRDADGRETGRELEYVMLVLGHKRHGRRKDGHTFVWLYHWGQPSLICKPATLRDCDCNALQAEAYLDWARRRGWEVRYLGSSFQLLPLPRIRQMS